MQGRKRPWLGFAGMLLFIAGGILSCRSAAIGVVVMVLGTGVLCFALITGNVKLFG